MAKQTFSVGQVLSAAQMTSLQATAMGGGAAVTKTASYTLVAADAGTVIQMNSASPTTITVNTALFAAGDSVQIQNIGAGACTVTAGTATVNTSGSLILAQYQGGILYFNTTSAAFFYQYATPESGDITAVTAGTGISGGGTSGAVTITNSMATEITASGDIIVGTGSGTFDNLPIGTTGQVLTADTTVSPYKVKWAAAAGGGKVLQVVHASDNTFTTSASATFSATSLTATITPSANTSKILILINAADCGRTTSAAGLGLMIRRGTSTDLLRIASFVGGAANLTGDGDFGSVGATYLDSPATTSATTYNLYIQNLAASGSSYINNYYNSSNKPNSTITLLEIGA